MVARILPAALAAMLAYGMVSSPVSAATSISQMVSIPATTASQLAPGGTALISFAQFNPTLGTLLGVSLSFEAVSDTTITIINNSTRRRTWTITPAGTATLSGNGFNLTGSDSAATTTLRVGPRFGPGNPNTASYSFAGSYGDAASLDSGLAPFLGTGAVEFTFAALNQWTATGIRSRASYGPDSYSGTARLDYLYELPAGIVPEPASWGLLIAGFALVGLSARRRRAVTLS
jgi:PEP-CTERM motif